jgi:hypothetical protein
MIIFFLSLHKHFASIIKRFRMMSNTHGAKEHEAKRNLKGGIYYE